MTRRTVVWKTRGQPVTQQTLFSVPSRPSQVHDRDLSQYMTPEWAAVELLDELYPDLGRGDVVLEPSCGTGAWLKAVDSSIEAVGVEIDPVLAAQAEENSGRRVICGDFRTVPIDFEPTLIVGNPPYRLQLLEQFIDRAYKLLPANGRMGFLLSSHMIQTPSTVLRWAERWSLDQRIIPRTLFPRSIRPLVFVMFTKNGRRLMGGFALYQQAADVNNFSQGAKLLLIHGKPRKDCWRSVVDWALRKLGGKATCQELYSVIATNRISPNPWWKEKVRQTLQRYFRTIERGVWALPEGA